MRLVARMPALGAWASLPLSAVPAEGRTVEPKIPRAWAAKRFRSTHRFLSAAQGGNLHLAPLAI